MRWIALAVAVYAIIEWGHMYAPSYQWLQNLPTWLGHVAFGIMLLAAVVGIIKPSSSSLGLRTGTRHGQLPHTGNPRSPARDLQEQPFGRSNR